MNEGKRFNGRKGDKKLSLLLVLRMLDEWSSKDHPIKQSQIVDYINNCAEEEVWCDRKTVGRHLKVLRKAGYRVQYSKGRGWYLENDRFTHDECDILLDLVSAAQLPSATLQAILSKLVFQQSYDLKFMK